ncbi:MAG TPA: hypothetical protein VIP11_22495 [Gemmatimonadaceae bacterium]
MTAPPVSASPTRPSREQTDVVRMKVRELLEQSPAFKALPPEKQREIANQTVQVCSYLAVPDGIPGNKLPTAQALAGPLSGSVTRQSSSTGGGPGTFVAQGAREGAAVAGALLQQVNFPSFVSGLIEGVFHAIVKASIEQMEAYGKLVADVAKTLNQFRDENVSVNQGRDYLVDTFPDVFQIDVDTGDPAEGGGGPRVILRDDVDESSAAKRVNESLSVDGAPITSLDDETIEGRLVPAARTQLATSRQQLLASMVLMGINRIIVTEGKIAAKVMYDFKAKDNFKYRYSATQFDYDPTKVRRTMTGEHETQYQGGESSSDGSRRDASYYTKGNYRYSDEPVLTLASATQAATDAALDTRASLSGQVEVNFKSETFPLEKMADSFQIGRIQDAAKPGTAQSRAAAAPPATTTPPASTPPK